MLRLVWFLGRDRWYYNEVYIRFECPAPDLLRDYVDWDRHNLENIESAFIPAKPKGLLE